MSSPPISSPSSPARPTRPLAILPLLLLVTAACSGAQTPPPPLAAPPAPQATASGVAVPIDAYQTLPPEQRAQPPAAAPTPAWFFPKIEEARLDNGLSVQVVGRHTLPLVEVRLVLRSGQASDGAKLGVAVLTGEMLKVGGSGPYASRQLLNRVESLGSSLNVTTSRDSTTIHLSVTSDRFEEAMDLLGLVVQKPQFDQQEFTKLRRREMDRVSSAARSDAGWAASMVLYRRLFGATDPAHPYAAFDGTSKELEQRQLWEVKQWYKTHVTPGNAFLLVVGDITKERVTAAAQKTLGAWRGKAPVALSFPPPKRPDRLQLVLVDRPKSAQAEVRLAMLGPERRAADWPAVRVANQVLGGGPAARLFLDVREKQSLAYSAYSGVEEVGHGPCPIVLKAGTQTAKAGLTLQALLAHASTLSTSLPAPEEVNVAVQYLSDVFLVNAESVGDLASLTTRLSLYGLGNDYYDRYREAVRGTTPAAAQAAFASHVPPGAGLAVVAGDAERLATPLSRFGAVEVVDPDDGFKTQRIVPHDPTAPVELERIDGT